MASETEWDEAWARCERRIFGQAPSSREPGPTLRALADRAPGVLGVDRYGEGELAERLESRVAELLGTEAAVWMPSGTMAQQIALRIHAERAGRPVVAFHPHCHLEAHEERAYQALHGLRAVLLGGRERLLTAEDVSGVREPIAALLLELPQRDLGGLLPAWDELEATCAAARDRGIALHLDGARLWQCEPFYGRSFAEIAALFDTIYVSFYKDLGAPAGCALAGRRELIDEARVWQIRHGGRIFNASAYMLAAERGLDELLPRLPAYVERAQELGAALGTLDCVVVAPDPPQTAMFHAVVHRPLEPLRRAQLELADERGVWCASSWHETEEPGAQRCELTVAEASLAVSVDEARELWTELLSRSSPAPAPG